MLHARPDYNRMFDPAWSDPTLLAPGCTAISPEEPVFVIRAKDITAPATVLAWAAMNDLVGGDRKASALAREHAKTMREWQRENGCKRADLPSE